MTTVRDKTERLKSLARRLECLNDGLYFARYFFKNQLGSKMLVNDHHVLIQQALDRTMLPPGHPDFIPRLIINVPPGYSKTSIAAIYYMARGLALNPRNRFLHLSYSADLALQNSASTREIVKSYEYQQMWSIETKDDSDSKKTWWTVDGGGVRATATGGQVTGFRAGHMDDTQFTGAIICFPYDEIVYTEKGPLKIGDVVNNRQKVNVYSFNHSTNKIELKPISKWVKNQGDDLIEIRTKKGSFRCTPDHKIFTINRGYVEAKNLTLVDVLPSYSFNHVDAYTKLVCNVLAFNGTVKNKFKFFFSEFARKFLFIISNAFREILPINTAFNGENTTSMDTIIPCYVTLPSTIRGNCLNNFRFHVSPRSIKSYRKGAMFNGVLHIIRLSTICKIYKSIVGMISINMPNLNPLLLRTDKSPHNSLVDKNTFNFPPVRKIKFIISTTTNLLLKRLALVFSFLFTPKTDSIFTSYISKIRNAVKVTCTGNESPLLIRYQGHCLNSYCLSVRGNHNLFVGENQPFLVHNCDDPIKPEDSRSEVKRTAINDRYNDTVASRLAVETVPVIVIMQRVDYNDLSGYLLRGGSGEMWHHLNLPVLIDDSEIYPAENTHAIPIAHNLPYGWLWPYKHNESHEKALRAHRRKWKSQYQQAPPKKDEESELWTDEMIALARHWIELQPTRTLVSVDPAVSDTNTSDEHGIIVGTKLRENLYGIEADYTCKGSPKTWAERAIMAYEKHEADAIVIEVNQGGDMCESTLRNAGYIGRVIRIRATKGKFLRAEPVSALYELGYVRHRPGLIKLEDEMIDFDALTGLSNGQSPNRVDACVYLLTELAGVALQFEEMLRIAVGA